MPFPCTHSYITAMLVMNQTAQLFTTLSHRAKATQQTSIK